MDLYLILFVVLGLGYVIPHLIYFHRNPKIKTVSWFDEEILKPVYRKAFEEPNDPRSSNW